MKYIKIKDILEFKKKSKIKASEGLKIGKYNFYTSSKEQNKFLDYYEYSNEALIIGTGGNANIHHSYGKFSVSTDCFVLENKNNKIFLIEYIYKYLLKNIHILENGFRGAGLKHISKEYLENIEIPIISIEKQRKLIKNLKKIDIFIDKNKQIKNELNFFNKSLFTRMFGDIRTNSKNWETKKIDECILNNIENINLKINGEIAYIDISSINNKENKIFSYKIYNNINEAPSRAKKILNEGDILISTVRPNLKNIAILNNKILPLTIGSTGFCVLRFKDIINNKYIFEIIKSDNFTEMLVKKQIGANYPAISDRDIKLIEIPVPPIELQNKFAERVEKIEKLSFEIEKSIKEAENLYNSLMNKYFD